MKRARPKARVPKRTVILRLDAYLVEHFRASGPGWQERINAALRKAARLPPARKAKARPAARAAAKRKRA